MTHFRSLILILSVLAITACARAATAAPATATFTPFAPEVKNSPTLIFPTKPIATKPIASALPSLTPTPAPDTATPTITATIPYESCGWVEARQTLPEVSGELDTAIRALAGDKLLIAYAEAYGENCMIDADTVGYFAAKETDFYVTLAVADTDNNEELGNLIAPILPIFDQFPVEQLQGPMPGSINIAFISGDKTRFLNFPRTILSNVKELSGTALIDALSAR
jgi:hypothetical protein